MFFHFVLQTPFVLTLQGVRTVCSNGDFVSNTDAKVGTDGPMPSLNSKYDIVKDLPEDVLVSRNVFQVLTALVMNKPSKK
jgi:hypothetical protein